MTGLSLSIGWNEVALRLGLSILAGLALGFNRSEHGKAAGLRTGVLVCVAAAVAMIQVNLLLPTAGRAPDSFVMNDLMRLPLGILTGVGFIGGGVILRRGNIVVGVTTAATLWLGTVAGLCIGGGQIGLGLVATAVGVLALGPMGSLERLLPREHSAVLVLELGAEASGEAEIRREIEDAGFSIVGSRVTLAGAGHQRKYEFELRCTRTPADTATPSLCESLAHADGVEKITWRTSN